MDNSDDELEFQKIDDRLANLEPRLEPLSKSIQLLNDTIVKSARRERKAGNSQTVLTQSIRDYVTREPLSTISTPQSSKTIGKALNAIADSLEESESLRKIMANRWEFKAAPPLQEQFPMLKREFSNDVKNRTTYTTRLQKVQREYDAMADHDKRKGEKLTELQGRRAEVETNQKKVETALSDFEIKRLALLEDSLYEVLHSAMMYHAKSLSMLSSAWSQVEEISATRKKMDDTFHRRKQQWKDDEDEHELRRKGTRKDTKQRRNK
eukprot:Rmarinus@m.29281